MVIKKLARKVYKNLSVIGKPMTMHVEAIYLNDIWNKIKEQVLKDGRKIHTFFVMTPTNYDYLTIMFNLKMSREKMSNMMKERYLWLLERGQKLELHVHTNFMMRISLKEQNKLIRDGVTWFRKNLGYSPKRFVPGWWSYNKDTLKSLEKFDLRSVRFNEYRFIHDYELLK